MAKPTNPTLGWVDPHIFSGEHFLLSLNWPSSPLAYRSLAKALLPILQGEGSSDSYIWPHFVRLVTF